MRVGLFCQGAIRWWVTLIVSWAVDREQLLKLTDAYKERIYERLLELVPERMAALERSVFESKATEEVLALVYMQGAHEALDAFDMSEFLRAVARESGGTEAETGLEA